MSEFKTPQSRNEAILQNILGASNVLESPKSRVEAILQAILNETEYNEPAQSRIEEILLAILNGDDYDGEGYSRNEKILIAGLNGEEWTEAPQSRIEELLIEWANSGLSVEWLTYTGTNIALLKDTMSRPIKSFTFFGKSVQDGTPTPEAPVEIKSAVNPSAVLTGLNLWDEEWERGSYASATGQKSTDSYRIRSKNPISVLPSTTYYAFIPVNITIYYYDEQGQYLNFTTRQISSTFTTPSNARFMNFSVGKSASPVTTYNNDICINLSDESVNGTYEPYKPAQTIIAEYTLRSVGDVKDTLVVRSDGTGELTQKFGIVDLGTLNWSAVAEGTEGDPCFYNSTDIPGIKAGSPKKMLCSKYQCLNTWRKYLVDKAIAAYNNSTSTRIAIRDTDYTSASAFKTSLSGVYLVYELATPVETELTAEQVEAILNGAQTYKPNTTITASNDNGLDQDFEIVYAHKAGAGA